MDIEELAFKDRKNLAQLTELDLLDIIEFLQFDRKQWINQFTQTHNESIDIQKENQELKKQVEEIEFIVGLRQKRNLISKFDKEYDEEDKKKNPNRDYAGIMPDAEEVYRRYYIMKTQQKEFIKYLEEEMKIYSKTTYAEEILKELEEILKEYKKIIGDNK